MNGDIRGVLARLVQTEGKAFYGDADRVEARLQEQASDHPRETAVLVTAVRAGVIDELLGVSPGLFNIAVGHLAGRMVRLHGADAAASRWAVETWADALGAWSAVSALPDGRSNHVSVLAGNWLYVTGGGNGGPGLDTVFVAQARKF